MQPKIDGRIYRRALYEVVNACQLGYKSATKYISPVFVVKATHNCKPGRDNVRTIQLVLKIGKPNFAERKFIRMCEKAGERFPVRKTQLKFWPK